MTLDDCRRNVGRMVRHSHPAFGQVEIAGIWFDRVQVLVKDRYVLVYPRDLILD